MLGIADRRYVEISDLISVITLKIVGFFNNCFRVIFEQNIVLIAVFHSVYKQLYSVGRLRNLKFINSYTWS